MAENRTIAAISTAQGEGGIGVIRISGDEAVYIADRVFRSVSGRLLANMKGYTAAFGHIYRENEKLDEAVATVFRSPHSYTGEDVVELSCHGGIFITREVLRAVLDSGAELAEAGEFTKRAFINGKLDLTEAEAVIDIITAKSRAAARAALYAKDGALWRKVEAIKNDLVATAAHFSAWADYPEEDIQEVSAENLKQTFENNLTKLDKLLNTFEYSRTVKEGIDTVIAGKPNTGKSTLMNLLAGEDRSIVTDIPGTTRDIVTESVMVGDVLLRLNDTAGIRSTDDMVEKIGVDIALKRLTNCGLVLAVFDGSKPLGSDDIKLLDALSDAPSVGIINKSDLPQEIDGGIVAEKLNYVVRISAKNGDGLGELTKIITEIAGTDNFNPGEGIVANERQREAVQRARDSLSEAYAALNIGMTLDAVTIALEESIQHILELLGENVGEAVVDSVFHNFCVGK